MQLLLARHLWGVDLPWELAFPRFKAAGYAAIETVLPPIDQRPRFQALLQQHGLAYIAQIFTGGDDVRGHVDTFRSRVADAQTLSPLLINVHSGRDAWSETESIHFYQQALEIEASIAVPVAHETHRGRVFYNPWVTARMLDRFDNLRLCADLSHWVVVAERLLDDQPEIMEQVAKRCIHLHARVGYEHGPQVPDPRAPEYQQHLAAHERWWDIIWATQAAKGVQVSTLTPEFGPPSYLHTLPYTNAPVADLEAICDWQAQRQAERFRSQRWG